MFVTTYALVLPAITLDADTASTQAGIDVAASENVPDEAGTVFESEEEEPAAEEETEEAAAEENSSSESGSQDAEAAVAEAVAENDAAEGEQTEALTTEEAATYGTTEEAIAAVTGQTAEEIKLITEETKLVFNDPDDEYVVIAEFGEDAKLPEGVELRVKEITKENDPEEYAGYYEKALAEIKDKYDENTEISFAKFYDIAFVYEGIEIEPSAKVNVKIEYKKAVEVKSDANVDTIHFDKNNDEKPEVIDSEIDSEKKDKEDAVKAVEFSSDKFSVYGVVGTELVTEFTISNLDGEDVTYLVTVTYGPEAMIPDGSSLRVTPYAEGSADYEYARNSVLADKKAKGESVIIEQFGFAALDISIIDPEGIEIEPEAPVQVDMRIKSLPGVDDLDSVKDTLEIQHHVETESGVIVDKVYDGNDKASFEQPRDEDVIADKSNEAIDPNSVSDEDFVSPYEEDIDASFSVEDFSTYSISWNYNRTSTTVHYGYMNGNTFVEFSEAASPVNVSTNYRTYLIYDFDGYEYSGYTYYRTSASSTPASGGTRIQAQLRYSSNNWRYHNYSTSESSNNWNTIANNSHIYVVYNQKPEPTTGGTPVIEDISPEDWPQDPATPQFTKTSIHNSDGVTNTVSLSISGGEKDFEQSTKANVIVVFDVSGSMSENLNGQTRLARAKTAVNNMANTLLNGSISGVKMALISFSTTSSATPVQGFTDNYNTYRNAVNGLSADGGTNWEQALYNANRLEVDDDAATFVVFVTDGDPTYRLSRYNAPDSEIQGYNRDNRYFAYNIFGSGSSDPNDRDFDAAAEEVASILDNNKTFYAIGVSSDVTKVQNLVDEAGGGTAYLATDAEALEEAFENITQSIKTTLGFGDVAITDGITELSNVEMKVMQEVDPESFTYYKITSSGQTEWNPASEGAGLANYDENSGAVVWNLGDGFQLEDGVTYMVTFKVWPSQEAYNLIAELNNGVKVYEAGHDNSITDEERSQVQEITKPSETTQGRYTLKTNTDTVNATYSQTSSTGGTVTVSGDTGLTATYHQGTIENMPLESMRLTIKKEFEDDLTGGEDRQTEVVLVMKRRSGHQAAASEEAFDDFPVPQGTEMSAEIVLNEQNEWTYSVYVAPGLAADGEVLEHGYDYTITEPGIDYHYGLIEEIINPMVVDGEDVYYGDGYLIDDEATISEYVDQSLTAVNRVKSGIDIWKHVYDVDGTTEIYPDTEFTITGRLLGPDGQPYTWQDGDDVDASGAYHKYDKDDNQIIYKGHFADTSNISFTLKAGEHIRFINVPDGCTFQFTESDDGMDALGYEWVSTKAVTQHKETPEGPFTPEGDVQPTVSGRTASLESRVVGNKQYEIRYGNQRTIALPDIELIKVDADDQEVKLNDAEFDLHKDSIDGDLVTVDGNGKEIAIKTGNKTGSAGPDGWYHIGLLPAGTYYLVETDEPDNYVLDDTPVIITVTMEGDSYTVTATRDGDNVLSGPTEGLYTITVDNKINITEAEADKKWKNADGTTTAPDGATVVFTLFADGNETDYSVTLDGAADETVPETAGGYESEGWKATFVNLPKYNLEGEEPVEIVYTIAETMTYPGYTASTTNPVENGGTITNTQVPTSANALKAWKNAGGSTTHPDGATVVFTLYADGTATNYTVTLDGTVDTAPTGTGGYESAAWKAEFINLPMYQQGTTTEIVYTIAETTTYPGYTASTKDPVASGETITNEQGSTDTFAIKAWKNADGTETAPDGATVVFTLYADGTATGYTVTLDGTADTKPTGTAGYESEAWTATFVNLPQYKPGTEDVIVYTIAETTGYPGYTASTLDPVASGSTITNSQDSTSAFALKEWENADGTATAPQGGKVTYTLYADGTATEYTVTLVGTPGTKPEVTGGYESDAWKAEFVNLPKYQTGTTTEIVYTIAESGTYPGYTASTEEPVESGETIKNTQEPTTADAIKAWKNADGSTTPPEGATVAFTLYSDGNKTDYTVTLDGTPDETIPETVGGYESEPWKAMFVNLPKYKVVEEAPVEIVYTIGETQTYPGYTPDTEDPVAIDETITNIQDDIDVYATKIWLNADGSDTAPEGATVVFTLYEDGEATEYTVTLNGTPEDAPTGTGGYESEAWMATFVNLPKYKADGISEIVYTIAETSGYESYEMDPTTPVESGGTITNRQISTPIELTKIGDFTTATTLSGVQFKVFADEDCTTQLLKDSTGADIGTNGLITTGSDGKAAIGSFVEGTYYLQEVKTADGYIILSEAVEFTVNADGTVTYTTGNSSFEGNPGATYETADGIGIYISNPSGAVLPNSGGPGTLFYTLGGLMLIIASALMYGFRMRRGERRFK